MSSESNASNLPTQDELERIFVNNPDFVQIESYLNRFKPIRVMGTKRMEIRHSTILAWLLNPTDTHGLRGVAGLAIEQLIAKAGRDSLEYLT